MKCYNEAVIQQYIDKECAVEEMVLIEHHLNRCIHCKQLAEELRERSFAIKHLFNQQLIYDNDRSIPTFNPPVRPMKLWYRRIAIAISAAAVILFIINSFHNQTTQPGYMLYQTVEFEMDANQPLSEQTFTMQLVDQNGKPIDLDAQNF